jgi:hypothetical protein
LTDPDGIGGSTHELMSHVIMAPLTGDWSVLNVGKLMYWLAQVEVEKVVGTPPDTPYAPQAQGVAVMVPPVPVDPVRVTVGVETHPLPTPEIVPTALAPHGKITPFRTPPLAVT